MSNGKPSFLNLIPFFYQFPVTFPQKKLGMAGVVAYSLLEIIAKYGVLIIEWGDLNYTLLELSIDKIALWKKNVRIDDWTAERAISASNDDNKFKIS